MLLRFAHTHTHTRVGYRTRLYTHVYTLLVYFTVYAFTHVVCSFTFTVTHVCYTFQLRLHTFVAVYVYRTHPFGLIYVYVDLRVYVYAHVYVYTLRYVAFVALRYTFTFDLVWFAGYTHVTHSLRTVYAVGSRLRYARILPRFTLRLFSYTDLHTRWLQLVAGYTTVPHTRVTFGSHARLRLILDTFGLRFTHTRSFADLRGYVHFGLRLPVVVAPLRPTFVHRITHYGCTVICYAFTVAVAFILVTHGLRFTFYARLPHALWLVTFVTGWLLIRWFVSLRITVRNARSWIALHTFLPVWFHARTHLRFTHTRVGCADCPGLRTFTAARPTTLRFRTFVITHTRLPRVCYVCCYLIYGFIWTLLPLVAVWFGCRFTVVPTQLILVTAFTPGLRTFTPLRLPYAGLLVAGSCTVVALRTLAGFA